MFVPRIQSSNRNPMLFETPGDVNPLKGAFQTLLSIYLLSLFFQSYLSWAPTNHKSLKSTPSAFISNLLSIGVNRNLMFVVFNALLFLVTRGFGFFGFSSNAVDDSHGEYLPTSADYHRSAPIEDKEVIAESLVPVENGIEVEEEGEAAARKENHYHQQNQLQLYRHRRSRSHDHDQHHHHHHYPQLHEIQREEEEDGQEDYSQQQQQDERGWLVLIEESDKSFDNFIERVKEGMKMEAKQLRMKEGMRMEAKYY